MGQYPDFTITYSYDEQDKLSTETLPSGKVISYSYDVDKLTSISLDGETLISDIAYNAANQHAGQENQQWQHHVVRLG